MKRLPRSRGPGGPALTYRRPPGPAPGPGGGRRILETAAGSSPRSDPAVAQSRQPRRRLRELPIRGAGPDVCAATVMPRVAAQEPDIRADPAQAHQRLADPGVVHVPFAVDEEVVLTQPVPGR